MAIEAAPKRHHIIVDLGLGALFVAIAGGIEPNCRKCEEFTVCLAAVSATEIEPQRYGCFDLFSCYSPGNYAP